VSQFQDLFSTEQRPDRSYWPETLPNRASVFVAQLEEQFGRRDQSFTLLGIEVVQNHRQPQLFFPVSGIPPNDSAKRSRHIIIQLPPSVLDNPALARWHLAHECFHLLDPWCPQVDERSASRLEEGLATWFQNESVPGFPTEDAEYDAAEALVRTYLDDLLLALKRIRVEEKIRISAITPPHASRILSSNSARRRRDSLSAVSSVEPDLTVVRR